VFDHAGYAIVAQEVLHLLRLLLRLEPDLAVDDGVPHGHQVRCAVRAQRGHGGGAALLDERGDLVVSHRDLAALVLAHRLRSPRFSAKSVNTVAGATPSAPARSLARMSKLRPAGSGRSASCATFMRRTASPAAALVVGADPPLPADWPAASGH